MLPSLLVDYPPTTELFRWLHDLVKVWDGQDNYYTFWFSGAGMPCRNFTILLSQHGQKKVEDMLRATVRCYKRGQLVDLGKMEEDLEVAIEIIKRRSHYSRLQMHEVVPFMEFFIDLLETVEIYRLELTEAGQIALAHLKRAYRDERCRKGNLHQIEELLEDLDGLVNGKLFSDSNAGEASARFDSESSGWIDFYPAIPPFFTTLRLDDYVQPIHSKEEWVKYHETSDEDLGCQQIAPSKTAIEAEEQCPYPR